jgi:hypothetical protein
MFTVLVSKVHDLITVPVPLQQKVTVPILQQCFKYPDIFVLQQ